MQDSESDKKNIALVKLLVQLRDHIDIHRILSINNNLFHGKLSAALVGYLVTSAQECIAIYICKIYEDSAKHDLNSLPGIIDSLPETPLSEKQKKAFELFGKKYGNHVTPSEARSYLKATLGLFRGIHSSSFGQFKEFRNTIGAHSASKAKIRMIPSDDEFEKFFQFAVDFYELVSRSLINVGPATVPGKAGPGLIKLLESSGIVGIRPDYDVDSLSK